MKMTKSRQACMLVSVRLANCFIFHVSLCIFAF